MPWCEEVFLYSGGGDGRERRELFGCDGACWWKHVQVSEVLLGDRGRWSSSVSNTLRPLLPPSLAGSGLHMSGDGGGFVPRGEKHASLLVAVSIDYKTPLAAISRTCKT